MVRPSPAIEVVPSTPQWALCRLISAAVFLCCCAALAGAPELAAEGRVNQVERSPSKGDIEGPWRTAVAPGPRLTVSFATPERGIEGRVTGAGTSISFRSRKVDGAVTATIRGAGGAVLYEYRELNGEMMEVEASDGSRIELRRPPELRVHGALYGSSTPEQVAALRSLATSREGRLIRRLGLKLYLAAPGAELVDERRGIELATQALWPHFPPGGPPALPLTDDYEVGPAGYTVLTQPYDMVLSTNRAGSRLPWEKHSNSRVNDCFGRCGAHCTGGLAGINLWPSSWTDTFGAEFFSGYQMYCVDGVDWLHTVYATPVTHTVTGWWTPGCQLHDNCCRVNPALCYTACNTLAPVVVASDPLGEIRAWTYTEYSHRVERTNLGYSGCTSPGETPSEPPPPPI